jgi:hypothetical protein
MSRQQANGPFGAMSEAQFDSAMDQYAHALRTGNAVHISPTGVVDQPVTNSVAAHTTDQWKRRTGPPSNMKVTATVATNPSTPWMDIPIDMVGMLIGIVIWIIGAKYTVDGIVVVTNLLLAFLTIPYQILLPLPWVMYIPLGTIPLIFSCVEWTRPPRQRSVVGTRTITVWQPFDMICIWLIIVSLDLLTTFYGVANPSKDAWTITQFIASYSVLTGSITAILTFWPEYVIKSRFRKIKDTWRTWRER